MAAAGALETDNVAQNVSLDRLKVDARDWRRDYFQLAPTSSKRPRSEDPDKEVD